MRQFSSRGNCATHSEQSVGNSRSSVGCRQGREYNHGQALSSQSKRIVELGADGSEYCRENELQNVVGTLQRAISSRIDVSDSACDDRPKWWRLCRAHPLFQQRGSEATALTRSMYSMSAVQSPGRTRRYQPRRVERCLQLRSMIQQSLEEPDGGEQRGLAGTWTYPSEFTTASAAEIGFLS